MKKYSVVNIGKNDNNAELRVICETKPDQGAKEASPSLEDYYLYVFGNDAKSVNVF